VDSCVTSGQLHRVDLGTEGPLSLRIVHGTRRCSIRIIPSSLIFPGRRVVSRTCLRMRDGGGIRFESLRLYLKLPQMLFSGLFVLRLLHRQRNTN
jgi:hypothetical protein